MFIEKEELRRMRGRISNLMGDVQHLQSRIGALSALLTKGVPVGSSWYCGTIYGYSVKPEYADLPEKLDALCAHLGVEIKRVNDQTIPAHYTVTKTKTTKTK